LQFSDAVAVADACRCSLVDDDYRSIRWCLAYNVNKPTEC